MCPQATGDRTARPYTVEQASHHPTANTTEAITESLVTDLDPVKVGGRWGVGGGGAVEEEGFCCVGHGTDLPCDIRHSQ